MIVRIAVNLLLTMRGFKHIAIALLAGFFTNAIQCQQKAVFGKAPKVKNNGAFAKTYKTPRLDNSPTDWTKNRLEFFLAAGATAFLGDLGGQDGPGKPFIYDFEPTQTRYSITGGVRYYLRKYHALRGSLSYGRLRGDDATTNYVNRHYRNLNFKSPVIQFDAKYEFYLLKPKTLHLAGARSTSIFNGNRFGAYVSAGAGFMFFNPKGELNGDWYALKPMQTEGQGMPNGPKPYKRLGLVFPLGGGVTYLLNRNYTIGLDFQYHWTTTDYIDDASGYFYPNEKIEKRNGKLAALFANPSVLLEDVPDPDWYTENQPRGGSQSNDTYLFTQITLSHSFTPSITNGPIKQKKVKLKKNYKDKKKFKKNKGRKARSYNNKKIKNKKKKFKSPNLNFGKKRKRNKIISF